MDNCVARAIALLRLDLALAGAAACLFCILAAPTIAQAEDWPPLSTEELQMSREPLAPDAPAIVLYRQVDRDDQRFIERDYVRIKILTEEGRQYANVEIPYWQGVEFIRGVEARTIRPDGSVVPFVGNVYDREMQAGFGAKQLVKAFALPDVAVGSIVEYRCTHDYRTRALFNSRWILSTPLFTKYAKFSLEPSRGSTVRWSWPRGLPAGTPEPTANGVSIRLETHDMPAFLPEDYMPPAEAMQYRVEFVYLSQEYAEPDPAKFWVQFAKSRGRWVDGFVDEPRAMARAVAEIVAPGDSNESSLRKLYFRVQQLHNLSYERRKSKQEAERDDDRDAKSVSAVWDHGAGTAPELTWLFLALVRAAGIHAEPVLVADRERGFFDPLLKNPLQLSTNLVVVSLDGKDLYLDPGSAFLPFGMLPWSKTTELGLVLGKDGGRWVNTPLPPASDSRILRSADLTLAADGALSGRVQLEFSGLEARELRLHERDEDAIHRQKYLEEVLKFDVPDAVVVKSLGAPDWESSDEPMEVSYEMTIPDWASVTGKRALTSVGLFSGRWKHAFEHASRIQPIYLPYPFEYRDDVRIALPARWRIGTLPAAHHEDVNLLKYQSAAADVGGELRLTRELSSTLTLLSADHYESIHDFFQKMRSGDAEQVVLEVGAAADEAR